MTKVLMIGSFLSEKCGTLSVSEKLQRNFNNTDIILKLASFKKNKILRLFEIICACFTGEYDKLHIDTFSCQAFRIAEIASFLGQKRKKRIILTLRGGKLPEFFLESPARVRKVFGRADSIQTPSLYLKDFFNKQGISVHYLPNSIELTKFPYSRENVKPHSILWVRAFTGIYNPDLAVKTLFEVKKRFPDATLKMIGPDKGLLSETKKLIKKLELNSSVKITGPVPNDQLYKYYQTHEVFLNTTSYESFGVAVLEAAACGIPVVSSNVGEIPFFWIHEEDILIVKDFEASNFSFEIIKIFSNKDLALKLSANARKKAESFSWEDVKNKWSNLLLS